MDIKNDGDRYRNIMSIGNFTKHAVEKFEENIVEQKDYLEKVNDNQKNNNVE